MKIIMPLANVNTKDKKEVQQIVAKQIGAFLSRLDSEVFDKLVRIDVEETTDVNETDQKYLLNCTIDFNEVK